MKILKTSVKTGDKIELFNINGEKQLNGEIGEYKDGKIKIFWYLNKFSGFSQYFSTRELNKQINKNKIKIVTN